MTYRRPLVAGAGFGTYTVVGLGDIFGQSPVHAASDEHDRLSWDELTKIANEYGEVIPTERGAEARKEFEHRCFELVFSDCQANEWTTIDKICQSSGDLLTRLKDKRDRSLLIAAVEQGENNCAKQLLNRKIALHVRGPEGNTPLHIAAKKGVSTIFRILVTDNSDPKCQKAIVEYREATNRKGQRAIHLAVKRGHSPCVDLLVEAGVDLHVKVRWKGGLQLTPAALAVATGHVACFDSIAKADPQNTCSDETAGIGNLAHVAVHFQQPQVLRRLLEGKYRHQMRPLFKEPDSEGRFPITLACYYGDVEAVLLLLQHHKGRIIRDASGKSVAHWAVAGKQPEVLTVLAWHNVKLACRDSNDHYPLRQLEGDHSKEAQITRDRFVELDEKQEGEERQGGQKGNQRIIDLLPPENLVFSGGGPKCIIEIGGLLALEDAGLLRHVKRDCGTSGGALVAALHATGHSPTEMEGILDKLDLMNLFDPLPEYKGIFDDTLQAAQKKDRDKINALNVLFSDLRREIWEKGGVIAGAKAVYNKCYHFRGFCKGDEYRKWIDKQIAEHTGIENCSFGQLKNKVQENSEQFHHLHMYASPLSGSDRGQPICFNSETGEYDDIIISYAVCASGGLPGLFCPRVIYKKNEDGECVPYDNGAEWVDGGITKNFPIDRFDQNRFQRTKGPARWETTNRRTLGLRIVSEEAVKEPSAEIKTVKDLALSIAGFYWRAEEIILLNKDCHRTRTIDLRVIPGVTTLSLKMTPEQKTALVRAGKHCTLASDPFRLAKEHRLELAPPTFLSKDPITLLMKSFIGRSEQLELLRSSIPMQPTDPTRVHLICGIAGSGKSLFALKLAESCYPHRISKPFIINCENETAWEAGYHTLAKQLNFKTRKKNETFEEFRKRVHRKMGENKHFDQPWILILDNLEKAPKKGTDYPATGGLVVITSRHQNIWSNPDERTNLGMLSEEESVNLLKHEIYGRGPCGQYEMKQLNGLASDCEYYPLALAMASRYTQHTGQSVAEYRHELKRYAS